MELLEQWVKPTRRAARRFNVVHALCLSLSFYLMLALSSIVAVLSLAPSHFALSVALRLRDRQQRTEFHNGLRIKMMQEAAEGTNVNRFWDSHSPLRGD
jgi:hypothetical protein